LAKVGIPCYQSKVMKRWGLLCNSKYSSLGLLVSPFWRCGFFLFSAICLQCS
jgi:hypothetical protein